MTRRGSKARYVTAQAAREPRPGDHHCHWTGCTVAVAPAFWGCKPHWFRLPKPIRDRIFAAYREGQEIDKRPSPEYLAATGAARDWINSHGGEVALQGRLDL